MNYRTKNILRMLPVLIFAVIIFIISSFEIAISGGDPGEPTFDWLPILHIGEFGLFSLLLMFAIYERFLTVKFQMFFTTLIGIAYGVGDEIHQYFVPTRWFDVKDIICDSVGVFGGIIGFFILLYFYEWIFYSIKNKKYYRG